MRRAVLFALLALAVPAVAQEAPPTVPPPPPHEGPLGPGLPTVVPKHRPEPKALRPIPYVWRPLNRARINDTSLVGRTNSVGSNVAGLRTGWQAPGTGGNAM